MVCARSAADDRNSDARITRTVIEMLRVARLQGRVTDISVSFLGLGAKAEDVGQVCRERCRMSPLALVKEYQWLGAASKRRQREFFSPRILVLLNFTSITDDAPSVREFRVWFDAGKTFFPKVA